ncbi:hypothetical protein ACRAR1_06915 [Streptomyces sanyensis]|uniref:hypothetical protein n=1 Tax=Streptomyces sanyensis TaxID=568869 RepID=UPI003D783CD5
MTSIGIPPRTPDEWDVPASRLTADMAALVARQTAQRTAARTADLDAQCAELRAHALAHLAARGETPTAAHYADWHDFLTLDPDLHGRDYTHPGSAR